MTMCEMVLLDTKNPERNRKFIKVALAACERQIKNLLKIPREQLYSKDFFKKYQDVHTFFGVIYILLDACKAIHDWKTVNYGKKRLLGMSLRLQKRLLPEDVGDDPNDR